MAGSIEAQLDAVLMLLGCPGDPRWRPRRARGDLDMAIDVEDLWPTFSEARWLRASRSAPRAGSLPDAGTRALERWKARLRVLVGSPEAVTWRVIHTSQGREVVYDLSPAARAWARAVARQGHPISGGSPRAVARAALTQGA